MKICLLLVIFWMVGSCSIFKKRSYSCDFEYLPRNFWVDSRLTSLRSTGNADTTTAFVAGQLNGFNEPGDSVNMRPLIFATVRFTLRPGSTHIDIETDFDGNFKTWLDPGIYDLTFAYIGYNQLLAENLTLRPGEMKEIIGVLGHGYGKTEYLISDDNEFVRVYQPIPQAHSHNKRL